VLQRTLVVARLGHHHDMLNPKHDCLAQASRSSGAISGEVSVAFLSAERATNPVAMPARPTSLEQPS
jgi:hypothetical protein